jgi:hypothetical protein
MFDTNELYNLLATGHSSEDIVALFTSSLNDAEAQLRQEEEAKAIEESRQEARRSEMVELMRDAEAYTRTYFPSLLDTEEEMSEEGWYAIVDLVLSLLDLEVAKGSKSKVKTKKSVLPVKLEMRTPQDVFAKFFEELGI